jgi:hypothetical protein
MRDNYVGDVGDFYKYALLRHLAGLTAGDQAPPLGLGVVWYRYSDPCNPNDGNHRSYLDGKSRGQYEPLDPDLYAAMAAFSNTSLRNLEEVASLAVLPPGTHFFAMPLSFTPSKWNPGWNSAADRASQGVACAGAASDPRCGSDLCRSGQWSRSCVCCGTPRPGCQVRLL